MRLIDGVEKITKKFSYPILTIGNFDGVHLGHQEIFRMITQRARKKHGTAIVFTFEPHPLSVIAPERAPKLLTTFRDKINLIKTFGIDVAICANFTTDFSHIRADDFARDILVKKIGVKEIYIGSNYHFGKGRKGTSELLTAIGRECGFTVKTLADITVNDTTVSSSKIRSLVAKGKVSDASVFLGRNYSVEGVVIEGAKRGKSLLNVPTANISTANELLPKDGVYAVTVCFEGKIYGGAANIGCNPTFRDKKFSFEVHILDFEREILGDAIRVNFIKRMRDEIKFSNVEELGTQMQRDIADIRELLVTMTSLKC